MKCWCDKLEEFFKHNIDSNIDGQKLFTELQIVKNYLPEDIKKAIEVLSYIKMMNCCLPNMWIAYRILLTIPPIVYIEKDILKQIDC